MRERGLKFGSAAGAFTGGIGRSREGAWIEIHPSTTTGLLYAVAPVRERGLKLLWPVIGRPNRSRSREGAWIEIERYGAETANIKSLP